MSFRFHQHGCAKTSFGVSVLFIFVTEDIQSFVSDFVAVSSLTASSLFGARKSIADNWGGVLIRGFGVSAHSIHGYLIVSGIVGIVCGRVLYTVGSAWL